MTETEQALSEIADLVASGFTTVRPLGGSRYFLLPTSPQLGTFQVRFPEFRRITGFGSAGSAFVAITKNGMTVSSAGFLADPQGNALTAPADVAAGQVIWVGQFPSTQATVVGLNTPVNAGEILYLSKNQAATIGITLYFDYH